MNPNQAGTLDLIPLDVLGDAPATVACPRARGDGYALQKRILDLGLCLLAAPLVLPLLLLCALAVKLSSPGPVLFSQVRTGKNGRRFTMYKFRSMVRDAGAQRDRLKAERVIEGPDFKLRDDPRITRVGAIMRKTSLDELPQLWNVLRGEMSLVGPRPTSFAVDTYTLWHTERLEVMPGLTGLWQVIKRGDLDFDDRVRLDIHYVRRASLALDTWILIRTVPAVLMQRGAY